MQPKHVVLVAEDDPLVRDVIVVDLQELGFEVVEADDAASALVILQSDERIDVLFTDIRMPGKMDGWDLAERAREMRPGIPVVYASGYSPSEARQVEKSLFVGKPYRAQHIKAAIYKVLPIG